MKRLQLLLEAVEVASGRIEVAAPTVQIGGVQLCRAVTFSQCTTSTRRSPRHMPVFPVWIALSRSSRAIVEL